MTKITPKIKEMLLALLCASFLSAFIYLDFFLNNNLPIFSTITALIGLFLCFKLTRFSAFICGGIVGILWFYWIALSLRFYDFSLFMPLVWIFIFFVYGVVFWLLCFFENPLYRLFTLTFCSLIHPFGFNWFILDAILVKSYIEPSKIALFCTIFGILIINILLQKRHFKSGIAFCVIFLTILLSAFPNTTNNAQEELKIKTLSFEIPQHLRWEKEALQDIIIDNLKAIDKAKSDGFKIVVLPETAFPIALNLMPNIYKILQEKSKEITIITGAIHQNKEQIFNSAYLFYKGEMKIFDKIILVPFGEKIPLPKFMANWVNETFFKGGSDFNHKEFSEPNSVEIDGIPFNIAICYEATREEFYKNSPKNLIAISNNAWFSPSTEATLQRLLMLYFSKRFNTNIYHSSNASEHFIIKATN